MALLGRETRTMVHPPCYVAMRGTASTDDQVARSTLVIVDAVPPDPGHQAGRGYRFVTVSQLFTPAQLTTDNTWSYNENAAAR